MSRVESGTTNAACGSGSIVPSIIYCLISDICNRFLVYLTALCSAVNCDQQLGAFKSTEKEDDSAILDESMHISIECSTCNTLFYLNKLSNTKLNVQCGIFQ